MLLEKTRLIKWVRLGSWNKSYWSKVDDSKFYRALKFMVRSDTAAVEFSLGLILTLWKKRIVVVSRIWNLFFLSRARINQLRFLLHHSMVLTRQGLKYLFLDALYMRKRTKGNYKAPNKAWHRWPWHQFSDYFSSCFGNWFYHRSLQRLQLNFSWTSILKIDLFVAVLGSHRSTPTSSTLTIYPISDPKSMSPGHEINSIDTKLCNF